MTKGGLLERGRVRNDRRQQGTQRIGPISVVARSRRLPAAARFAVRAKEAV